MYATVLYVMISRIVDVKRRTVWGGFVDMSSGLRRNFVCV